jgi:hypothetical protein
MARLILAASAILVSAMMCSCKKAENATCAAGPGGNTEIVVFALHNGDTIIHSVQQADTAFVAWSDPGDPPNPNFYDKFYEAEAGEDHIHLTNLHCGTYRVRLSVFDSVSRKRLTGIATVSYAKSSGEVDTAITVN